MSQLITIITSLPSPDLANQIARDLIQSKLAASAQIFPINSVYSWQGEVYEDDDFQLQIKTIPGQYRAVAQVILENHPYEIPEIYAIAATDVYQPYAQWIEDNSRG